MARRTRSFFFDNKNGKLFTGISFTLKDIEDEVVGTGDIDGTKVSDFARTAIQTSLENFSDSDTVLMTAAAIDDRINFVTDSVSGGISNVVEDTTPQLGGNLDTNGNSIGPATQFQAFNLTSYNGDITIDPAYGSTTIKGVINTGTTQRVSITLDNGITLDSGTTAPGGSNGTVIDGLAYPSTDGSNGQVLTTNGSGTLLFADASGGASTGKAIAMAMIFGG